jgi:hypothetical protein
MEKIMGVNLEASVTTPEHASAKQHAAQFSPRKRQLALAIVALAFVMDLLDSTIVNIAIPSIQTNLHASYTAIQWLIAGYLFSFATLLITGGRMGDVFGYKKLFLTGVAGFSFAYSMEPCRAELATNLLNERAGGSVCLLRGAQSVAEWQIGASAETRCCGDGCDCNGAAACHLPIGGRP